MIQKESKDVEPGCLFFIKRPGDVRVEALGVLFFIFEGRAMC